MRDRRRWPVLLAALAGIRLSDHISLGVITRAVPPERMRQVLLETGKASERGLPAR
jgi:TRAP-type C4-dicarboxylate transport system permease small subunit